MAENKPIRLGGGRYVPFDSFPPLPPCLVLGPREQPLTTDRILTLAERLMRGAGHNPRRQTMLRCKMFVTEVLRSMNADGSCSQERVTLSAVTSNNDENKEWSKWTPAAQFSIHINNPDAMGTLAKGHEFYVDFTDAQVAGRG